MKSLVREVLFLLNAYLKVMTIIVQIGATRQEHQKK